MGLLLMIPQESPFPPHQGYSSLLFLNKFKGTCPDLVEDSGTNPDATVGRVKERGPGAKGWLPEGTGIQLLFASQFGTMLKDYHNLRTPRAHREPEASAAKPQSCICFSPSQGFLSGSLVLSQSLFSTTFTCNVCINKQTNKGSSHLSSLMPPSPSFFLVSLIFISL